MIHNAYYTKLNVLLIKFDPTDTNTLTESDSDVSRGRKKGLAVEDGRVDRHPAKWRVRTSGGWGLGKAGRARATLVFNHFQRLDIGLQIHASVDYRVYIDGIE